MKSLDKDVQMRVYIMDSLASRAGKVLDPYMISEITAEILQRMIEIHEVPMAEWEGDIPQ